MFFASNGGDRNDMNDYMKLLIQDKYDGYKYEGLGWRSRNIDAMSLTELLWIIADIK